VNIYGENHIEYRHDEHERAELGPGPWQDEPDKVQWIDRETGLNCLIKRNPIGALCGYVGVEATHPLHGVNYGDMDDIEVHGGLTYSSACDGDEQTGICHVPVQGRGEVWWFGFDCAHAFDLAPSRRLRNWLSKDDIYRDINYVKSEVEKLALQLKARA